MENCRNKCWKRKIANLAPCRLLKSPYRRPIGPLKGWQHMWHPTWPAGSMVARAVGTNRACRPFASWMDPSSAHRNRLGCRWLKTIGADWAVAGWRPIGLSALWKPRGHIGQKRADKTCLLKSRQNPVGYSIADKAHVFWNVCLTLLNFLMEVFWNVCLTKIFLRTLAPIWLS